MVNHWFGGKEGLFAAAMDLPINPEVVLARILDGTLDNSGNGSCAPSCPSGTAPAAARSRRCCAAVASHEQAATMIREFVTEVVFGRLADVVARTGRNCVPRCAARRWSASAWPDT